MNGLNVISVPFTNMNKMKIGTAENNLNDFRLTDISVDRTEKDADVAERVIAISLKRDRLSLKNRVPVHLFKHDAVAEVLSITRKRYRMKFSLPLRANVTRAIKASNASSTTFPGEASSAQTSFSSDDLLAPFRFN